MKKVLIAHQSTIPHYRIPFYNALERSRPSSWEFSVAFDSTELKTKNFFREHIQESSFAFPIQDTKTYTVKFGSKRVSLQSFLFELPHYDLVIVEHALNNLAYPLSHAFKMFGGVKLAYWGIGRDMNVVTPSAPKALMERLKVGLAKNANGYFAYTDGVKAFLLTRGINPRNVYVLNNTIDIAVQRETFVRHIGEREAIRKTLGLEGKTVLLFVGRITRDKRFDFLLRVISILNSVRKDFHLLVVGSGDEDFTNARQENVSFLGPVVDLTKLGPLYVTSDLFVFPRGVGLGPLQAFCYDLPVITIESPLHGPEFEYLSKENSIVLPSSTSEDQYAQVILDLTNSPEHLRDLRSSVWPSIEHLTIEQMAQNFTFGVNDILGLK